MKIFRKKLVWLLVLLLLLPVGTGCNRGSVSEEESEAVPILSYQDDGQIIEVEKEAPNFSLTSLDGEVITLEDYRGQIVMLTFFSST